MKNSLKYVVVFVLASLWFIGIKAVPASAQIGDIGFFGGISEGRRLPRTTEQLLVQSARSNRNSTTTLNYTELVFLGGRPVRFDGLIDITVNGGVTEGTTSGTFTANYRVYPGTGATGTVTINRTANFTVSYRVEGSQVIYNYDIVKTNWRETIQTPDATFTLVSRQSSYGISVIEDRTPGVNYYRGDLSGRLVYTGGNNGNTTVDQTGSFYGYDCAWSSTETHRMDVSIMTDDWGLQYQIRPSVTVNKVLQYTWNEPTAISFEGNYKEVTQNITGLKYDIMIRPNFMWDEPLNGTANLTSVNTFEQLPAPDLTFLKGNAAEDDIRKLFAMQVLTGETQYYQPTQAITRGQFMTALAKAIKLPIEDTTAATGRTTTRRQPVTAYLFTDVDSTRPEYPYIMAIRNAGIAYGRDDGMFYFDYPIERQEAFVAMVRALGLTQLGLNPTPATAFADDAKVAAWAKREVAVAQSLGLIAPDAGGNIYPTRNITKGEAAALLNSLIEYMRNNLVSDYAEQIVNIIR